MKKKLIKLSPEQKLIKAEEEYLRSHGWKVKNKLWSPPGPIGLVIKEDKLHRDTALKAQKQASRFSYR